MNRPTTPRVDRAAIGALVGLMVLGALFVYSATMVTESAAAAPLYNQSWFRQMIWYAVGTALAP